MNIPDPNKRIKCTECGQMAMVLLKHENPHNMHNAKLVYGCSVCTKHYKNKQS